MKFPIFNKNVQRIGEARQVMIGSTSLDKVLNNMKEDINRVSNKTDIMFISIPYMVKENTQASFPEEENDYLVALFNKPTEEVLIALNNNVLFYTNGGGGAKECASKPIFVYANELPSSGINYIVFAIPVTDGESILIHTFVLTKNENVVTLSDISASSFVYSDGLPLFQET